jgi:Trypsin-like peptidase domain
MVGHRVLKASFLILLAALAVQNVAGQQATSPPLKVRKDIPTIAKAATPAVVLIVMANDDEPISTGTGFVVESSGIIVTNYHVIQLGNKGFVKFSDGTAFAIDGVLAADKLRDLAVIKIHRGKSFPTLTLGNSDQLQVGEEVVAIGDPLGLELTVSNGIVSAIRTVEERGGRFLQITAPISHGSSGGPLFNMAGEVIGITSMYFEGGENLNFAIPINDAKSLVRNCAGFQALPNEPEDTSAKTEPESKTESPAKTESVTPVEKDILWMNEFASEHSQQGEQIAIEEAKPTKEAKDGCAVFIHHKRDGLEQVYLLSLPNIKLAPLAITSEYNGHVFLQFETQRDEGIHILTYAYANGRVIPPVEAIRFGNIAFDSHRAAEVFASVFEEALELCRGN